MTPNGNNKAMDQARDQAMDQARDQVREFALAFRQKRLDLGLTQGEIADITGVSRKFVSQFETGKQSMRMDMVVDLLDAVGITLTPTTT